MSSPKWQKYNIFLVKKFLAEYAGSDENCVLELGSGHSVYQDDEFLNRAKEIFAPYPNVVLVQPSENVQESLELLLNQIRNHGSKVINPQVNKVLLEHPSNRELAKFVVYTKGKTPGETCQEICRLVHTP